MVAPSQLELSLEKARSLLFASQSLPFLAARPLAASERSGLVRTLGGIDVYLALRARVASLKRADVDAAVESSQLQVVPAVRGCIYLAPRSETAWMLRTADLLSRRRREREHEKAGIRKSEIEEVAAVVAEVLGDLGASTPNALRRALPEGLVRSLGDAGKKVGISSTLPPALRQLELTGTIERTLEGGRLDSERYLWRLAASSPFAETEVAEDPAAVHGHLADLYFRAAGIGSADRFAAWAGIGKREARRAAEELDLVPVGIEGVDGPRSALASVVARLDELESDGVALLPFEDNLIQLQGGAVDLVDARHHGVAVPIWGGRKPSTLGEARHMSFRSVVIDGRVVGFWEYDPDAESIETGCFAPLSTAQRKKVKNAAEELAAFIASELGHGRSFSLDTDDDLRRRVAQLRGLSAT